MIGGFSIDKLEVEKKVHDFKGKVSIKNSLKIKDVKEEQTPFKDKKTALRFSFEYSVDYAPKLASITINGSIIYISNDSDEIIKEFKKSKKITNQKVSIAVMNAISDKCNIRALELSQDVNIPSPFNLPKLNFKSSAANYIG